MKIFVVLMALVVFSPAPAYAYLDPGSASMILQVIVAAIAGALVSLKIYWTQVSLLIKNLMSKKQDN